MAPIAIRVTGSRRTRSPAPEGTTTGEGRRRPIVHALTVHVTSARVTIVDRVRPGGRGSPRPTRAPRARRQANGPIARGDPSPIRPRGDKPWRPKPPGSGQSDRPWRPKPPGSGPADGRGGQSRRAIGRPTVAAKADRLGRAASVEAEAAVRRGGTRTGSGGQAAVATQAGSPRPTCLDSEARRRRSTVAAQAPWAIAATSHGGPSLPGDNPTGRGGPSLPATAPKNPGGPSHRGTGREAVAAQARSRTGRQALAAQTGWRGRLQAVGSETQGGPSRPPREKDDQGPPNDRSPREERGRKGGTRLVKKVRR